MAGFLKSMHSGLSGLKEIRLQQMLTSSDEDTYSNDEDDGSEVESDGDSDDRWYCSKFFLKNRFF